MIEWYQYNCTKQIALNFVNKMQSIVNCVFALNAFSGCYTGLWVICEENTGLCTEKMCLVNVNEFVPESSELF